MGSTVLPAFLLPKITCLSLIFLKQDKIASPIVSIGKHRF